jgi:structural maintenance of chromosome 1
LEKRRKKFEKEIEQESLSQGTSLELRESKMREYQNLKEQVAKQNTKIKDQLDTLNREQKSDQDAYDNELRKKNDATVKINQKTHELEDQQQKLSKLVEYIE